MRGRASRFTSSLATQQTTALALRGPAFQQPLTVEQAISAFLEHVSTNRAPHTAVTYRSALRRFSEYLEHVDQPPGSTLTCELPATVLEHFLTALRASYGRKTQTATTMVGAARSFLSWTFRRSIGPRGASYESIRGSLQEAIGRQSYRPRLPSPELLRVVRSVEQTPLPAHRTRRLVLLRDRALFAVLLSTGARRAEVASLNRADLADGWHDSAVITGKGGKVRTLFFDPGALERIRAYLAERRDDCPALFARHGPDSMRRDRGDQRLSVQGLWYALKTRAAAVGVQNLRPHDFRHVKATVMLNRGASLSDVQDILGHSDPGTTKRVYVHLDTCHLRASFDRYSLGLDELLQEN